MGRAGRPADGVPLGRRRGSRAPPRPSSPDSATARTMPARHRLVVAVREGSRARGWPGGWPGPEEPRPRPDRPAVVRGRRASRCSWSILLEQSGGRGAPVARHRGGSGACGTIPVADRWAVGPAGPGRARPGWWRRPVRARSRLRRWSTMRQTSAPVTASGAQPGQGVHPQSRGIGAHAQGVGHGHRPASVGQPVDAAPGAGADALAEGARHRRRPP